MTRLAWSPDGETLFSASQDGTLRRWDVNGGQATAVAENYWGRGGDITWSSDSTQVGVVYTEYADPGIRETFRVWDLKTEQSREERSPNLDLISPGNTQLTSPDGRQIAFFDVNSGQIRIFDSTTREEIESFDARGQILNRGIGVWTKDGLIWVTQDDNLLRVWQQNRDEPLLSLQGRASAWLSPSGRRLATWGDGVLELWDIEQEEMIQTLAAPIMELVWSPDQNCLAATLAPLYPSPESSEGVVSVWDVETGQPIAIREARANDLAWSPDGTMLATTSDDGTLRIWGAAGE